MFMDPLGMRLLTLAFYSLCILVLTLSEAVNMDKVIKMMSLNIYIFFLFMSFLVKNIEQCNLRLGFLNVRCLMQGLVDNRLSD